MRMNPRRRGVAMTVMALTLGACTTSDIMPTLTSTPPSGKAPPSSVSALAPNPPQPEVPQVSSSYARPAATGAAMAQATPPRAAPTPVNQGQGQGQPPAAPPMAQPAGPTNTPGTPTGTFVGQKIQQQRAELVRLQGLISTHNAELQQNRADMIQQSRGYHQTVAAVNARLQVGTPPAIPSWWRCGTRRRASSTSSTAASRG
ncbi:MAG: hypothetical protein ACT4N4_04005 [Rhodospirillales bacterium]